MRITADNRCGRCNGLTFLEGPHGGLSINVRCVSCGATYFTTPPGLGQSGETDQSPDLFHGEPRTLVAIFADARTRGLQ